MGFFFFDESVHQRGDFVLGAFVYTISDPSQEISRALATAGLAPGVEEYKSGILVSLDSRQLRAREELRHVLNSMGRIALVILPFKNRQCLGLEALAALARILVTNEIASEKHRVHFDEGIFRSDEEAATIAERVGLSPQCELYRSDSRTTLGLQLSDLVAHIASSMLLEQQGVITKLVKAGGDDGYPENVPLGFDLWAGIRHYFLAAAPPPFETWESQLDWKAQVEPYGLYVSPLCGPELAEAARERFGSMYLGCIH